MSATEPLWHSGSDHDHGPVADRFDSNRGAAYGDGVFETILMIAERGWLLDRHMARLAHGVARLQLQWPGADALTKLLHSACMAAQHHPQSLLKLLVQAAAKGRGYGRAKDASVAITAALYPSAAQPGDRLPTAKVLVCDMRLGLQPQLAGIKHCNRLEQVLASNEWQAGGYDEGLMLDTDGHLIEGTHSNVIVQFGDQLVTPSLTNAGVAGVFREHLLEHSLMRVAPVTLAELTQATGLWLVNSVFGLRCVRQVDLPQASIRLQPEASAERDGALHAALQASLQHDLQGWNNLSLESAG